MSERKRYHRLKELFNRALELAGEERSTFVDEECGEDHGLRESLLSLLRLASGDEAFVDTSAAVRLGLQQKPEPGTESFGMVSSGRRRGSSLDDDSHGDPDSAGAPVIAPRIAEDPAHKGDQIGSYRIVKHLGRGGMGVVYLAEQIEPVRRQVALKIIQTALRDHETRLRFESERQAMARLSHPAVAQLFEAGTTEDGHLFFAMELVDGLPITDYCDQQRLSIRERLELMRTVCDGVQHAHQKGILHRDLKPDNILIAEIEDWPVAKIIDFGIAKAIDQPLVDGTLFTGDRLIGTPAYLSPEAMGLGDGDSDIDTRSDVYSLGVVLYELLVGVQPFECKGESFLQVLRRITADEPIDPSTRWRRLDGTMQENVAYCRRLTSQTLGRRLKSDLDWIVQKAIAKNRRQRYGSPAELSADLLRHLKHQPVEASPPSTLYRVGKFVRRRRGVVVAASLILVSLLLGLLGTTLGLVRASLEAERANQEAVTSKKALEETQEVSRFLADLFEVSDPGEARGNTITARELLDRGAEKISSGFRDQPLARARFMLTIGEIYQKLGLYEKAEPLLSRSLEIRERELVPSHFEVAASLYSLGLLYLRQGRYEDAEPLIQRAIPIQESALGSLHPDVAKSLESLGWLYLWQGRYQEAESNYQRALQIREEVLGPDHPDVANSLNSLGSLYYSRGSYQEAEPLYIRALQIRERVLGLDHPSVAGSLYNLGSLYYAQGRYEKAEQIFLRALEVNEKVLGPDHPDVAWSLEGLGSLYREQERYEDAERCYQRAREIKEKVLGPDHPDIALIFNRLGVLCWRQGRYEDAESYYERSLEINEKLPGADDRSIARNLNNLGLVYWKQGKYKKAERYHQRALAISQKKVERNDPLYGWIYWGLAGIYRDQGNYLESESFYKKSLELREKALEPGHRELVETLTGYAQLLRAMGREAEANQLEARARVGESR